MCEGSLGAGTFILREALERASSQNEFVMSVTISAQVLYSTVRALPTVNRDGFTNHSDGCDDSFVALLGADTNHNREVLCFKDRCCLSHTRTDHVGPSGDIIGPLPLPRESLRQCARKPLREGG